MRAGRLEQTFARRVRDLAAEKAIPLSHLADRTGMARSYFWRILGAKVSPTLATVQRLADVLQIEPAELLRGKPGAPEPLPPDAEAKPVRARPSTAIPRRRRPASPPKV